MSEPFLAQIALFGFNFAPKGWAFCQGQLMPISQNTALFSLLGTIYGGDGKSNFALPNLQGRVPLHFGQGPGLSSYNQGQTAGSDVITLLPTQIPAHTHAMTGALTATAKCKNGLGNAATPVANVPASEAAGTTATYSNLAPNATMKAGAIAISGSLGELPPGNGQPHPNLQPYLTMSYCIALQGVFPPRS